MMIFFFRGWKENEKTSCDVVVTLAFLMNDFLFFKNSSFRLKMIRLLGVFVVSNLVYSIVCKTNERSIIKWDFVVTAQPSRRETCFYDMILFVV